MEELDRQWSPIEGQKEGGRTGCHCVHQSDLPIKLWNLCFLAAFFLFLSLLGDSVLLIMGHVLQLFCSLFLTIPPFAQVSKSLLILSIVKLHITSDYSIEDPQFTPCFLKLDQKPCLIYPGVGFGRMPCWGSRGTWCCAGRMAMVCPWAYNGCAAPLALSKAAYSLRCRATRASLLPCDGRAPSFGGWSAAAWACVWVSYDASPRHTYWPSIPSVSHSPCTRHVCPGLPSQYTVLTKVDGIGIGIHADWPVGWYSLP